MKRDVIVMSVAILALAAAALLLVWLQPDESAGRAMVEALAGPQPTSKPPSR
jgi:hypothetical protein